MKKILVAVAMMAMFATPALAVITGTAHDLSSTGPQGAATGTTEVCVFCHTPHGGNNSFPLWNRTDVATTGTAYTSGSLNASIGAAPGEAGACLSCHDGVSLTNAATIVNEPNSNPTSVGALTMSVDANIGTDMSNDHPVGFNYDAALVTADGGGLVAPLSLSEVVAGVPLFEGTGAMWCSTCHDVHGTANPSFLTVDNANSDLCLTCHVK